MINIDADVGQSTSETASIKTLEVNNLKTPVTLDLPVTNPRPHDTYECAYYNESLQTWTTLPGGTYDQISKSMHCESRHLSVFTVLA